MNAAQQILQFVNAEPQQETVTTSGTQSTVGQHPIQQVYVNPTSMKKIATNTSRAQALEKIRQATREQQMAKSPRGATTTLFKTMKKTEPKFVIKASDVTPTTIDLDPSLLIKLDPKKQSKEQKTLTLPSIEKPHCETQNICIEIEVDNALNVGELESCRLKNGKTKFFFKISKHKLTVKAEEFIPKSKQKITITPSKRRAKQDEYEDEDYYDDGLVMDDEDEEEPPKKKPAIQSVRRVPVVKDEKEEEEGEIASAQTQTPITRKKKQGTVVIEPLPFEMKDDGTIDAEDDENFDDEAGDDDDDFEEEIAEAEAESKATKAEAGTRTRRGTRVSTGTPAVKTPASEGPKRRGRKPRSDDGTPEVRSLTKAVPKSLADETDPDGTPKRSYFRTNAYAKNDKFLVLREGGRCIFWLLL